ncbi:hypothetical protein DYB36_009842 [Aphanomyces astaci]|uniref:Protein transport protein sec16 n=1 Tax=Aphanomyces astaci TaxID=112090 RepID=A0A396ZYW5_APHAT|nr:hypothetical protein DYB36_009842 [Aphanomyces astaci]
MEGQGVRSLFGPPSSSESEGWEVVDKEDRAAAPHAASRQALSINPHAEVNKPQFPVRVPTKNAVPSHVVEDLLAEHHRIHGRQATLDLYADDADDNDGGAWGTDSPSNLLGSDELDYDDEASPAKAQTLHQTSSWNQHIELSPRQPPAGAFGDDDLDLDDDDDDLSTMSHPDVARGPSTPTAAEPSYDLHTSSPFSESAEPPEGAFGDDDLDLDDDSEGDVDQPIVPEQVEQDEVPFHAHVPEQVEEETSHPHEQVEVTSHDRVHEVLEHINSDNAPEVHSFVIAPELHAIPLSPYDAPAGAFGDDDLDLGDDDIDEVDDVAEPPVEMDIPEVSHIDPRYHLHDGVAEASPEESPTHRDSWAGEAVGVEDDVVDTAMYAEHNQLPPHPLHHPPAASPPKPLPAVSQSDKVAASLDDSSVESHEQPVLLASLPPPFALDERVETGPPLHDHPSEVVLETCFDRRADGDVDIPEAIPPHIVDPPSSVQEEQEDWHPESVHVIPPSVTSVLDRDQDAANVLSNSDPPAAVELHAEIEFDDTTTRHHHSAASLFASHVAEYDTASPFDLPQGEENPADAAAPLHAMEQPQVAGSSNDSPEQVVEASFQSTNVYMDDDTQTPVRFQSAQAAPPHHHHHTSAPEVHGGTPPPSSVDSAPPVLEVLDRSIESHLSPFDEADARGFFSPPYPARGNVSSGYEAEGVDTAVPDASAVFSAGFGDDLVPEFHAPRPSSDQYESQSYATTLSPFDDQHGYHAAHSAVSHILAPPATSAFGNYEETTPPHETLFDAPLDSPEETTAVYDHDPFRSSALGSPSDFDPQGTASADELFSSAGGFSGFDATPPRAPSHFANPSQYYSAPHVPTTTQPLDEFFSTGMDLSSSFHSVGHDAAHLFGEAIGTDDPFGDPFAAASAHHHHHHQHHHHHPDYHSADELFPQGNDAPSVGHEEQCGHDQRHNYLYPPPTPVHQSYSAFQPPATYAEQTFESHEVEQSPPPEQHPHAVDQSGFLDEQPLPRSHSVIGYERHDYAPQVGHDDEFTGDDGPPPPSAQTFTAGGVLHQSDLNEGPTFGSPEQCDPVLNQQRTELYRSHPSSTSDLLLSPEVVRAQYATPPQPDNHSTGVTSNPSPGSSILLTATTYPETTGPSPPPHPTTKAAEVASTNRPPHPTPPVFQISKLKLHLDENDVEDVPTADSLFSPTNGNEISSVFGASAFDQPPSSLGGFANNATTLFSQTSSATAVESFARPPLYEPSPETPFASETPFGSVSSANEYGHITSFEEPAAADLFAGSVSSTPFDQQLDFAESTEHQHPFGQAATHQDDAAQGFGHYPEHNQSAANAFNHAAEPTHGHKSTPYNTYSTNAQSSYTDQAAGHGGDFNQPAAATRHYDAHSSYDAQYGQHQPPTGYGYAQPGYQQPPVYHQPVAQTFDQPAPPSYPQAPGHGFSQPAYTQQQQHNYHQQQQVHDHHQQGYNQSHQYTAHPSPHPSHGYPGETARPAAVKPAIFKPQVAQAQPVAYEQQHVPRMSRELQQQYKPAASIPHPTTPAVFNPAPKTSNRPKDPSVVPRTCLAAFGFGGTVCVMFPRRKLKLLSTALPRNSPRSLQGSSHSFDEPLDESRKGPLDFYKMDSLHHGSDGFYEKVRGFPGPLLPSTSDEAILKYMGAQGSVHEDERVLWELMHVFVKSKGKVSNRDATDMLLLPLLQNSLARRSNAQYDAAPPPILNTRATDESNATIRQLLLNGDRKAAVDVAVAANMWPEAMLMASMVDSALYKSVVESFVSSRYGSGDPLRTMLMVLGDLGVQSVQEVPNNHVSKDQLPTTDSLLLGNWVAQVQILIANPTTNTNTVLVELGDRLLRETNNVWAAHTCFLLAGVPVEAPNARMTLIGGHATGDVRFFVRPHTIQWTEVYEHVTSPTPLVPFQGYKFIYATLLADAGCCDVAFKYVDAMRKTLETWTLKLKMPSSPYLDNLKMQLDVFDDRLRFFMGQERVDAAEVQVAKKGGGLFSSLTGFLDKTLDKIVNDTPLPPAKTVSMVTGTAFAPHMFPPAPPASNNSQTGPGSHNSGIAAPGSQGGHGSASSRAPYTAAPGSQGGYGPPSGTSSHNHKGFAASPQAAADASGFGIDSQNDPSSWNTPPHHPPPPPPPPP